MYDSTRDTRCVGVCYGEPTAITLASPTGPGPGHGNDSRGRTSGLSTDVIEVTSTGPAGAPRTSLLGTANVLV